MRIKTQVHELPSTILSLQANLLQAICRYWPENNLKSFNIGYSPAVALQAAAPGPKCLKLNLVYPTEIITGQVVLSLLSDPSKLQQYRKK